MDRAKGKQAVSPRDWLKSPRKVLITRPRDEAEAFAAHLRAHGVDSLIFPTIEIVPPESWQECDARIQHIDEYTDLLFTSANAVRFFFDRCARFFDPTRLRGRTFHAVGPKTRQAIVARGFVVAPLPESFDARHLAEQIGRDPTSLGRRFLFLKGDRADEVLVRHLRAAGLMVDSVTVYRTVRANPSDAERRAVGEALRRGEVGIVVFFSPSSVRHFVEFFPEFPALVEGHPTCEDAAQGVKIAVIGETTARACREHGLPVHIRPIERTGASPAHALIPAILRELGYDRTA